MFVYLLGKDIGEEDLAPCYVLFGEEEYLAQEFVSQLRSLLIAPEGQEINLERFVLAESSWMDIIDLARTMPFFFSPWRLIVVTAGEKARVVDREERIIKDYLASPSQKTVLVVIGVGKWARSSQLVRFFSSVPAKKVKAVEIKPLKGRSLAAWVDRRLASLQKRMTADVREKLIDVVGNDLRSLENELEKLAVYSGEKTVIDREDVSQVSIWAKSFEDYEFSDAMEEADWPRILAVLDQRFKAGITSEYIVGSIAWFFRDVLQAKTWLKEGAADKNEIFRQMRPQIQKKWETLYTRKFKSFYALVEGLPLGELNTLLRDLSRVDFKIKTSDTSPHTLLEAFLFEYCRKWGKKRSISAGQG